MLRGLDLGRREVPGVERPIDSGVDPLGGDSSLRCWEVSMSFKLVQPPSVPNLSPEVNC